MTVLALRGAITVDADLPAEVKHRTTQMLEVLFERNQISADQVISIYFTVTSDVASVAPAAAARAFGLVDVPLLCAQEMATSGGLERCIRLLAHVETGLSRAELRHVFLRQAVTLRPELAEPGDRELP